MANELTMDKVFAIRALDEAGWSMILPKNWARG
jgi:hypothetical protein